MKKFSIIAAIILSFIALNATASNLCANTPTKFVIKNGLPEGTQFAHNKITLKKGYIFKKTNNHNMNIIQAVTGKITGTVSCDCSRGYGCDADDDNGDCESTGCRGVCFGTVAPKGS